MNRFSFKTIAFFASIFLCCFLSAAAQKNKSAAPLKNVQTNAKPSETLYSEMEKALLDEINAARTNPLQYVAFLEEYKKSAKGNSFSLPGDIRLTTTEDAAALIDDAIAELKKLAKSANLGFSNGLIKAAQNHNADLKNNFALGHLGKDGSGLEKRLAKVGSAGISVAENLSYGAASPREILMSWILDDGIKSRAHRKNIFSPRFSVFGVSCNKGANEAVVCVALFANSFTELQTSKGVKQIF